MENKDNLFNFTYMLSSKKWSSHQAINSSQAMPWVSTGLLRGESSAMSSENLRRYCPSWSVTVASKQDKSVDKSNLWGDPLHTVMESEKVSLTSTHWCLLTRQ